MRSKTSSKVKLNSLTSAQHFKTELKPTITRSNKFITKRDSTTRFMLESVKSPKTIGSQKSLGSPQQKLSNMIFVAKSESNLTAFKIPTLQLNTRTSIKSPKISYSFQPLDFQLAPNYDSIFVLKSPIPDLLSFKAIQISRSELTKRPHKDIYFQRESIIHQLQLKLNVPKQYHYLSLYNNQPIQFFQEIPDNCNLIFLGCSVKPDFWTLLFQHHQYAYSLDHLNKLLNLIFHINTIEDLHRLLTDREVFRSQMEYRQLDQFNPFLTELKPQYQQTKDFY